MARDKPTNNTILMNEVIIIVNRVRYDAVEDTSATTNNNCDLYDMEQGCKICFIGMNTCERLIGVDGVFKKSDKKFEV